MCGLVYDSHACTFEKGDRAHALFCCVVFVSFCVYMALFASLLDGFHAWTKIYGSHACTLEEGRGSHKYFCCCIW